MAFIHENFRQIGFNHSTTPACFSYATEDGMAEVKSLGYFSDPRANLSPGDYILVYANGESDILVATTDNTIRQKHPENFTFVDSFNNLPLSVNNVITLEPNHTYYIANDIDLQGRRLVAQQNTTIIGSSSENCKIKSTGLSGDAILSSAWSLPLRHVTLEAEQIFNLDASLNSGQALDWYGVNLSNTSNVGLIKNYSNFIASSIAFLSATGLVFDGSFGTIAFSECIFTGNDPGTVISIPATATVTRRFRVAYSSFVITGSGVGVDVSTSATVPVEGYIYDTCNFAGGGTYTAGVAYDDNKARWTENRGVNNSAAITGYYMQGNATATTIAATGTPVKVAGITTEYAISQRFTHSSNRATHDGAITRDFKITAICSLTSGNGHQVGVYVAKNGTTIDESETYLTTNASGRLENGAIHTIASLQQTDYIEIFVENNTATNDITVEDLNVIVEALN